MIELERVDPWAEAAGEWAEAKDWAVFGSFRLQAAAQGFVDDLLERDVEQSRSLLEGVGEVVVEGASNGDTAASMMCRVKVFACAAWGVSDEEDRGRASPDQGGSGYS